jgi:hypothetical protein
MKTICLIAALSWHIPVVIAGDPKPIRTEYASLKIEELAMRFRFPERYKDLSKGEPAPRDTAVREMVRRNLLRLSVRRSEVEFLLGEPGEGHNSDLGYNSGPRAADLTQWSYDMVAGKLLVHIGPKGIEAILVEHLDADHESAARFENLLFPIPRKTEPAGTAQPATPPKTESSRQVAPPTQKSKDGPR